ncbi:MAG: branched-chain amino acid ABC transporter permease [Pseudomonadota bacterium]
MGAARRFGGAGRMSSFWRGALLWALFAALMLALPEFVRSSTLRTAIQACFLAIFAMSWDFISGRTGYVSFGHPFLIGIGAYATAILSHRFDVPLTVSIPSAVVITMFAGTLFFLPALRIRGTYFALVTLAFMELMYQLVQVIRPDLTGGTRGMSGIDTILRGARSNYYLTFSLMLGVGVTLWLIGRTRLGTALNAIGMNEAAVRGSGLDTTKLKLFAFMTAAFVAGLGGAFFVHYNGSLAPRALFDINFLFTIIVAALIGGTGTVAGPIAGAFFLTFLLEWLRPVLPGAERYFIYGGVALVLYVYQPKGLAKIASDLSGRLRRARS